jgi:hypothetical protein
MPLVRELLLGWTTETLEPAERLYLEEDPHDRRMLHDGTLTHAMRAKLLVVRLEVLDDLADAALEVHQEFARMIEELTRRRWLRTPDQKRESGERVADEQRLLEKLQAIEATMVAEGRSEVPRTFDEVCDQHRALADELKLQVRRDYSNRAVVAGVNVGDRARWRKLAQQLRRELGPKFIYGSDAYRASAVRRWLHRIRERGDYPRDPMFDFDSFEADVRAAHAARAARVALIPEAEEALADVRRAQAERHAGRLADAPP